MLMLLVTNWDSQDLVNLHCAITTFNSLLLKLGACPTVVHIMVKGVVQYTSAMLDVWEMNLP